MLDTPTSSNVDDFRQRYRGTYGFLKRPGKADLLVYIKDTNSSQVVFQNVDGNEFYAYLDQQVMFEFLPIIRGWHNTRSGPRYFMRIPERQYHRGISRGNTSMYYLSALEAFHGGQLDLRILEDVFVLKPTSSFIDYQAGKAAYFIPNKYFLLTEQSLFMYDRKIGVVEGRRKIVLDDGVFTQEVKDFVQRQRLSLEVVSND